ncbi:YggL family protein [Pragia fontium]|uniref:DUF469 domain-containing protein n=2 Tax=Pragia fontium TaxID=82985 RepID=A0AAJ4WAG2_9GAMM|nr:YggL family protein [Pragia fontium]AKJ42422.1 hypothetical protein QQ39_10250 [Pragia fontium]SFC78410.1 hypothetical protein SAMN02745723_104118 [Pragia fontium DSM 5563 = ATCC 49100]SUB82716.1 Uncharacterized protein conserved in bacteria [Pragia fontium]VEJ55618.1 Uncharacterized protein conserved in bacteria [Pragia fontium]GKX61481.1 hypothetical protein SOASR032_00500 [Pragia fontium]
MAQPRSRRLRKKLHLDEFQEIGFTVNWNFTQDTDIDTIDAFVNRFIKEVIEPNGLGFGGSGYIDWEGIVCLQKIGSCTEEHRKIVADWLTQNGMENVETSELYDIWWE